jgi:1-deoxy-D-xylulose-5-phosphate synthase
VLLHVRTVKGKGFAPAERNPDAFHGTAPFHPDSGLLLNQSSKENFSSVFGDALLNLARDIPEVCAITAAMEAGTGLAAFAQEFPNRFFDVGIAEGHAVSMAAGMAKQGLLPVFAVYSTFLQRSYDMLLHDVAISKLHVVFCVDRAGFVGDDGETHHGLFDVSYLSTVPGMMVLCPASHRELSSMLRLALTQVGGPVAVRYPRGSEGAYGEDHSRGPATVLMEGNDITLVSYGTMIQPVLETAEALKAAGYAPEVLKLNRIAPLDEALVAVSVSKTGRLLVAEEVAAAGCVGERILSRLMQRGVIVTRAALVNCGDGFITHGTVDELRRLCGLDAASLTRRGLEVIRYGR